MSDEELEEKREALRLRYVSSGDVDVADHLYDELHGYDVEMTRRANEAYDRENPNPPEPRWLVSFACRFGMSSTRLR